MEESKQKTSKTLKQINADRKAAGLEHPNTGIIRIVVECPHCGKSGAMNTMKRWHFDNCKSMVTESEVVEPTVRETVY